MEWWMQFAEKFGLFAAFTVALGLYIRKIQNENRADKLACEQERVESQKEVKEVLKATAKDMGLIHERTVSALEKQNEVSGRHAEILERISDNQTEITKTLYKVKCAYSSGQQPAVKS